MFEGWADYYLLVGSAAAALTGLLFVVATLTGNVERQTAERGARYYMTPIVFHLAVVLVMSGLAMAPELTRQTVALLVGLIALVGALYTGWIAYGFVSGGPIHATHWSDTWFYGVAPPLLYLFLGAVAAGLWSNLDGAIFGPALFAIGLLLVSIRNAWDLVTWIAPRAGENNRRQELHEI